MRFALPATLAAFLLAALPAAAERMLTPDEFAAMTTGRTLHFDRFGEPFGTEQFFDDGRVIWRFEGGGCQRGIWFANRAGEICFVYDGDPASQCWSFMERSDGRFIARLDGADPAEDLLNSRVSDEALDCPAPDVGI